MENQKTTPERFVRVPMRIADGSLGLTPAQIYTYLALAQTARNADAKHSPRLAQWKTEGLARAAGVSGRSLQRILKTLVRHNLIARVSQHTAFVLDADLTPGSWLRVPAAVLWTAKPRLHVITANLAVAGQEDEAFGGTPRLSATALRALFGLLLVQDWETGEVSLSAEYIASRAAMSKNHYHQGLKSLVALGLVEKEAALFVRTGAQVRRKRVHLQLRLGAIEWKSAVIDSEDPMAKFVKQTAREKRAISKAAKTERQAVVKHEVAKKKASEAATVRDYVPTSPSVSLVPKSPSVPSAPQSQVKQRVKAHLGAEMYERVGAALNLFADSGERLEEANRLTDAALTAIQGAGISDLQFEVALRDAVPTSLEGRELLDAVHTALEAMEAVSLTR